LSVALLMSAQFSLQNPSTTYLSTLSLHDALPIYFIHLKTEGIKGLKLIHGSTYITSLSLKARNEELSANYVNDQMNYLIIYIIRSEEHTSELQSRFELVCRLLLSKNKNINTHVQT